MFFAAALLLSFILSNFDTNISLVQDPKTNEKPIVIVIPSYNNKNWYVRNLNSVFSQNYNNYRVIYVDDASPDGTGELVKAFVQENNQQQKITLIQNTKRQGALSNLHKAIWLCRPDEIVANLDGDDWFYDENVLSKLNHAYSDPKTWVTYGQFVYYPENWIGFGSQLPSYIIEENSFRENCKGYVTALRTFYAGLFQKIKSEDLLYNGEFFPMAWDIALMLPILEMSGSHSRFIPDLLYVYNIDSPINDFKVNASLQAHLDQHIRRMPKYSPLEKPYD